MRHTMAVAIAFTSLSTIVGSTLGQVTLVSQQRATNPTTTGPAAGFGPYTSSGATSDPMFGSAADASQTSDLSVTGATFNMVANGTGSLGTGTSTLTFVFNAVAGVQYTLNATGYQAGGPGSFANSLVTISLTGPGVNDHETVANFTDVSIHTGGTLSGGTYTLAITAWGDGDRHQGHDWTGSGTVIGTLTLSPTPGAAALLGLTAIPASRRRRYR